MTQCQGLDLRRLVAITQRNDFDVRRPVVVTQPTDFDVRGSVVMNTVQHLLNAAQTKAKVLNKTAL